MFNPHKIKMRLRKTLNAIIYIVPACLNTRAFMTKETEDNLAWIKYWIVFSLLFALEILLDFHKSCFPCYDYFKVFLLCFCIVSIEINLSTQRSSMRSLFQVIMRNMKWNYYLTSIYFSSHKTNYYQKLFKKFISHNYKKRSWRR